MSGKPVILLQGIGTQEQGKQLEKDHVHYVYDNIASHFSQTRYKPWPIVSSFLSSIPAGWVGLDSGTGNGKYLPHPLDRPAQTWMIGLDRSLNLLRFARNAGGGAREVVLGDAIECCWRPGVFDYAISIATIHHFSTPERRKIAVKSLLRSLSPSHGRALIYVWATQQDELSKRSIPQPESSRPEFESHNGTEDDPQIRLGKDVFVPWTLTTGTSLSSSTSNHDAGPTEDASSFLREAEPQAFNRYYHMFDSGELRSLVQEAAGDLGIYEPSSAIIAPKSKPSTATTVLEFVQDGWERSNFFVEIKLSIA